MSLTSNSAHRLISQVFLTTGGALVPAVQTGTALALCLQESDCVMVQRHSALECLSPEHVDTLPTKCQQLKKAYGECRRGMVDMRKRFRGNQPASYYQIEGADRTGDGYQLYAGKAAFAGGRGETDGNQKAPPDWREVENEKFRQEQAAQAAQASKKA